MTIDELLAQFEPRLRRAFLAGVRELSSQARVSEIAEALERGDVQGAVDLLYLDRAAYQEFEHELQTAFGEGGLNTIKELGELRDQQGQRFVVRFNARNIEAERVLEEHSSSLVTRIVDDQRVAVRQALTSGMERGQNPRTTARQIVGTIDRRTGKREGGILGLSSPQERAVDRARSELLEGNYAAYLQRERRDRRFDSVVRRAQREERQLTQSEISRLTGRYSDRLLALRGETIGRTETLSALHEAQYEAIRQVVETGKVNASDVRLVWIATRDLRTRDTHRALDRESVRWGEEFTTPRGARLRYPGDPQGGAAEVINCRCSLRPEIRYRAN